MTSTGPVSIIQYLRQIWFCKTAEEVARKHNGGELACIGHSSQNVILFRQTDSF